MSWGLIWMSPEMRWVFSFFLPRLYWILPIYNLQWAPVTGEQTFRSVLQSCDMERFPQSNLIISVSSHTKFSFKESLKHLHTCTDINTDTVKPRVTTGKTTDLVNTNSAVITSGCLGKESFRRKDCQLSVSCLHQKQKKLKFSLWRNQQENRLPVSKS